MSCPSFPPEILDIIVDFLRKELKTLQNCCLVAKSWVPRTRKLLFSGVVFSSPKRLESWKETFPDPSNSPARYTRFLFIQCPHIVTADDAQEGGWIRAFSRVVCLDMVSSLGQDPNDSEVSLVPLHGFSPVLKTFRLFSARLKHSQIFDLICSLPLLENLTLVALGTPDDDDLDVGGLPPPSPPVFTGSLMLLLPFGVESTARRLLDLPNALHFRHLMVTHIQENDLRWVNALVVGCSATLESLEITCNPHDGPLFFPIDLSTATNLKDVEFWDTRLNIHWVIATLKTIPPNHRDLQGVSIHVAYEYDTHGAGADIGQTIGEIECGYWLDLDRYLIQFWESSSIRPKIIYFCTSQGEQEETIDCVSCLLPEAMRRGIINLVKYEEPSR